MYVHIHAYTRTQTCFQTLVFGFYSPTTTLILASSDGREKLELNVSCSESPEDILRRELDSKR